LPGGFDVLSGSAGVRAGVNEAGNSTGPDRGPDSSRRYSRDGPLKGAKRSVNSPMVSEFPRNRKPPGFQAVVKDRQKFFLQLRRQVDEQVPATHQVELGERRIHDDVLRGKDDRLPDGFGNLVAVLHLKEEPAQAFGGNIRGNVGREHPRAGFLDGVPVQVGCENLEHLVANRF